MTNRRVLPIIIFSILILFTVKGYCQSRFAMLSGEDSTEISWDGKSLNTADSTAINLINLFKAKKFIVTTTDGKWYEGYVTVVSDGLRVFRKRIKSLTKYEIAEVETIYWSRIEEIRLLEVKRHDFRTGFVAGTLATFGFLVFLTFMNLSN